MHWTALRHRMLRAIADGKVARGLAVRGWAITGPTGTNYGRAENTVSDLVHAHLAGIPAGSRHANWDKPLEMYPAGVDKLAEWNTAHPDATTEA